MILNDLYKALKEIGTQSYFILNEKDSKAPILLSIIEKRDIGNTILLMKEGGNAIILHLKPKMKLVNSY